MNHREIVVREGLPFIILPGTAAILAVAAGASWMASLLLVLTVFAAWFFRNPERTSPEQEGVVLSPADGRVIGVETEAKNDLADGLFKRISIFMNVFNVHVNRIPCSGKVRAIRYREGKFLSANLDKASELNERNAVLIVTHEGKEIITVQIAGLIARRIVCWLEEGMSVKKGERFGLIRFGSRLEVFLPGSAAVTVKVGDKVRAGETTIGVLT